MFFRRQQKHPQAPSATDVIHIVNRFNAANNGSATEALALQRALSEEREVRLWASKEPHPQLLEKHAIEPIEISKGQFPKGGIIIFAGHPTKTVTDWFPKAKASRVHFICNFLNKKRLERTLKRLNSKRTEIRLVYPSKFVESFSGIPGEVLYVPVDLSRFSAAPQRPAPEPFTVGRLSRDEPKKFHSEDPELYRRLVAEGCRVRILGGTAITEHLKGAEGIELLPSGTEDAASFLQNLSCFTYRTSEDWAEPWGRVVCEAMACALPVVCENRGGYSDLIEHGKNGFAFTTTDEAVELIRKLKADPELGAALGRAGRETVERLYEPEQFKQRLQEIFLSV